MRFEVTWMEKEYSMLVDGFAKTHKRIISHTGECRIETALPPTTKYATDGGIVGGVRRAPRMAGRPPHFLERNKLPAHLYLRRLAQSVKWEPCPGNSENVLNLLAMYRSLCPIYQKPSMKSFVFDPGRNVPN